MTEQVRQLIEETIELTGADPPAMLDPDAPVLSAAGSESMYLIGLVGGKDVGKSSLVNALVGQTITAPTSHGPGTETVIAYAHESVVEALRWLLDREVPGRYSVITHSIDRLRRQVLLDLPDIDSHWGQHVQITRRMPRHMLFPLWIQSVEKYADLRPQELLAAVAEGNDPANFIFCLNKADQLDGAASSELRQDYARRIARTLELADAPRVFLISARRADQHDLPALRDLLSSAKPAESVQRSVSLAERRQDHSLFGWIEKQNLADRARQLERIERDAEEFTSARILVPLLDQAVPRILDDPGQRMALLAPAVKARMARWPVVNAIDALLSPLVALVQKSLSESPTVSADPDAYLAGTTVSATVQATFAQLHQLHPQFSQLYQQRKLWESMPADLAAVDLRRRFANGLQRQRQAIAERARGRFAILLSPLRWLLTIGAILWFPIIQPVLSAMLETSAWKFTLKVLVDVLSVSHLLQCSTFLLLWFLGLWALLRYSTQRSVHRMIEGWKSAELEDELSLSGQAIQWVDDLLSPIRQRRQRLQQVVERAEELRSRLTAPESAVPGQASVAGR